jgi:hypothetical protein
MAAPVGQLKFFRSSLTLGLAVAAVCRAKATPSIEITNVPAFGSFANLGGCGPFFFPGEKGGIGLRAAVGVGWMAAYGTRS